ncbi:pyruvate dehydrogenase (acetyl-transferring) E1 component subunit alpha [Alkalihalobacillus sp. 1P02AB]|uniref:pyruvate dehydrogenase (acetyl-transferring) E1 component subunit alpha n=1 Tax=Alkalihalobacillus sp. 1P02AB TaxID=3132260 RepID=UPI0039A5838E
MENYKKLVRVMDDDGGLQEGATVDLSNEQLRELYQKMLLARLFDERAFRLQRQGRIGTYPPFKGQEAAQIGSVYNLEKGDWLFPYGRDLAACFAFEKDMKSALLYTMGHKNGSQIPDGVNIFPLAIMIPPQILHAVGASWASKLKGEDRVSLATFGDGGTSKGDFHEGLNMASVYKTPTVFLCINNQWAISVPIEKQMASETVVQKSVAYGMNGVRVDGNDVLAVYQVTKEAVERARSGEGPTLIEALTYRVGPHTTSDDPTRYREDTESKEWEKRDPVALYKKFLIKQELWSEEEEQVKVGEMKELINQALKEAEATPKTELLDVFEHVFEEPTDELKRQKEQVENLYFVKK